MILVPLNAEKHAEFWFLLLSDELKVGHSITVYNAIHNSNISACQVNPMYVSWADATWTRLFLQRGINKKKELAESLATEESHRGGFRDQRRERHDFELEERETRPGKDERSCIRRLPFVIVPFVVHALRHCTFRGAVSIIDAHQ